MTSKHFPLFLVAVLSLFILTGFASAATTCIKLLPVSVPTNVLHDAGSVSFTFNVTNDQSSCSAAKTGLNLSVTDTSGKTGTWTVSPSTISSLAYNSSQLVSATATFTAHQSGYITPQVTMAGDGGESATPLLLSIHINDTNSLSISSTQDMTTNQNATISITNNGNTVLSNMNLSSSGDFNVSFSSNNFALTAGQSTTVNVRSLRNLNDLGLGSHSITILALDLSSKANSTLVYNVQGAYCKNGNMNASTIEIVDVRDVSSDTSNKWEWKPLDNVQIEVKVGNEIGKDKDFVVRIGLYDTEKNKFIDLNGDNYLEQSASINDGSSETVSFEFQVPSDIVDSDSRYVLYVKAYVDGKESSYCNSYAAVDVPDGSAESITITKKSKDIILNDNDITVSPELVVEAGDTVHVSARAYNIGTDDQDKVKVTLYNSKLGLNLESQSFSLSSGDSQPVDFTFVVPYTVENGVYTLQLTTYFDYSKSSDIYRDSSATPWNRIIKIAGGTGGATNATTSPPLTAITASLDSDAIAGQDLVVTALIQNLATGKNTFIVDAKDFESWATLKSISDRILTLNGSESKEVKFTFAVDPSVSGEKTFTIETKAGDHVDSKSVAVTIGEGTSWTSSLSGAFGNKTLLWIIGGINLILIILIIVLAVRILRR